MKRIVILVVLVLVIATSLALTPSIATAQRGGDCPEGTRPAADRGEDPTQPGPPGFLCVPLGTRGGPNTAR